MSKNDWAVLAKLLEFAADIDEYDMFIILDDTLQNNELVKSAHIYIYGYFNPRDVRHIIESKIEVRVIPLLRYFFAMALKKSLPLPKAIGGG